MPLTRHYFRYGNPHAVKYVYILLGQLNDVDKLSKRVMSKTDVWKQWMSYKILSCISVWIHINKDNYIIKDILTLTRDWRRGRCQILAKWYKMQSGEMHLHFYFTKSCKKENNYYLEIQEKLANFSFLKIIKLDL